VGTTKREGGMPARDVYGEHGFDYSFFIKCRFFLGS